MAETKKQTVVVTGPLGGLFDIDPNSLDAAQKDGYRLATDAEIQADEERKKYGGAVGTAAAAAAAGARGLSVGLSDVLLTKSGAVAPETLAKLREYSPVVSGVSEFAGAVAPTVLSGGAGALGLAARATPVALGARAATAGTTLATRAVGEGLAARIATRGLIGGVEGGLYGMGSQISESAIANKELTAEQLVSAFGLGAMLGGGAFGIAPELLGATGRKIAGSITGHLPTSEAVDNLQKRMAWYTMGEGRVGVREVERAQKLWGDDYREKIGEVILNKGIISQKLTENDAGKIAKRLEAELDKAGKKIGESIDTFDTAAKDFQPKRADLSSRLDNELLSPLKRSEFSSDKKLAAAIEEDIAPFLKTTKEVTVRPNDNEIASIKAQIAQLSSAREALPELKKQLKPRTIEVIPSPNEIATINERLSTIKAYFPGNKADIAELEAQLKPRKVTYTPTADEIAETTARIDYLNNAKTTIKTLENSLKPRKEQVELEPWTFKKLHEYRRHLDKRIDFEHRNLNTPMADKLRQARAIIEDALEESGDAAATSLGADAAKEYLDSKKVFHALKTAESVALRREAREQAGQGLGMAPLVGTAIGGAVTGQPIGAMIGFGASAVQHQIADVVRKYGTAALATGLEGIGGKVTRLKQAAERALATGLPPAATVPLSMRALLEPMGTATAESEPSPGRKVADLIATSGRVDKAVSADVNRFFGELQAVAAMRPAPKAGKRAAVPIYQRYKTAIERHNAFGDRVKAAESATIAVRGISDVAPSVSVSVANTAQRAVEFLQSKRPAPTTRPSDVFAHLDKRPRVSDSAMAKYLRYTDAVEDPQSAIKDFAQGRLSNEAAEALRVVYPQLHASIEKAVTDKLVVAEKPLPYKSLLHLSVLLNRPLHPSMEPGFIQSAQSVYASARKQSEAPSSRAVPNFAKDQQTQSQRIG